MNAKQIAEGDALRAKATAGVRSLFARNVALAWVARTSSSVRSWLARGAGGSGLTALVSRGHSSRRSSVLSAIALAFGALLMVVAIALVSPLSLIGAQPEIVTARASFEADLATYRATPIDFASLPALEWGAVAFEDRAFFDRPRWLPQLSPSGLARAIARNLRGIREGASTIPAQVAKLYLRDEGHGGLGDKLRELLFASWAAREATPEEILGLYLNLTASRSLGSRDPVRGIEQLSLALFGLPLQRIAVDDQLILAATPRGIRWLRSRPVVSLARIASAQAWLAETGHWPEGQAFDLPAEGSLFRFSEGWRDVLASGTGRSPDLDLALAIDAFRTGLRREIQLEFWSTSVQSAFAVIGESGAVIARSGSETATMMLNYGSIAKIEPLTVALEALGPTGVRGLALPPAPCVRWFWSAGRERFGKFCPTDVTPPGGALSLDKSVARSINTSTARHVALLPYRLWLERPELFASVAKMTSDAEKLRLDSEADRAISANLVTQLGISMRPEDISRELSYSALQVSWFRYLKARRAEAGLPADRLPDDPTQILGNSSRASLEEIGSYVHRRLFAGGGECRLSETGAMLAAERREGTLRWLAAHRPKLVFAGKTGTSPHDDSVVAVVALCVDGRPVVLAAGARPIGGTKLPKGFHGSVLLRGVLDYLKQIESLERPATSPGVDEEVAITPVIAEREIDDEAP